MKRYALACLVSAILGAVAALIWSEGWARPGAIAQEPAPNSALRFGQPVYNNAPRVGLDELTPEERVNIFVYETVNLSVVNISTKTVRSDSFMLFEVPAEGSGSGTVLDKQGHILTNFHVIEGSREIQVTLHDGKTYEARLVGQDATNDVSVIRIDAPPDSLHPVVFGDSNQLHVGQNVYAIGNPFGLERTLTTGVISSLNRSLPGRNHRTLKSIIQIDAAINPGNSGGPLLDSRSRLIGMNTAIASRTGQSSGVGFAIPVSTISRIVPKLISHGRVVRPEIGIVAVYRTSEGLRIAELIRGGPAERAGLLGPQTIRRRKGPFVFESIDRSAADLIVAVDGQRVSSVDEFLTRIESHEPGQQVVITVLREGREVNVPVRLGEAES